MNLRFCRNYLLVGLLGALFLSGCTAPSWLEPTEVARWNAARSEGPAALVGRWSGRAPDGSIVGFVFAADGSCEWLAQSRMFSCRYSAKREGDGLRIQIFALPGKHFENVEFWGWGKAIGDSFAFEGEPVREGLSEQGAPITWRTEFTREAWVLRRTSSAN